MSCLRSLKNPAATRIFVRLLRRLIQGSSIASAWHREWCRRGRSGRVKINTPFHKMAETLDTSPYRIRV